MMTFKETLACLRADAYRYQGDSRRRRVVALYFTNICFRYTTWMRLASYLRGRKILFPFTVYARLRLHGLSRAAGIQIPAGTKIGKGLYIGHGMCIVINPDAELGDNVNLSQGVTLGQANRGKNKGAPKVGNQVYIGPGAKIVGAVTIGNNVAIGANAVVTKDVPDNAVVGGVPAKVISYGGTEGYIDNIV